MYKLNCGHVRCVVGVTVLLVFTARSRVVLFVLCNVSYGHFTPVWTVCGFCMEHDASVFRVFAVGRFLSCTAVFVVFGLWSCRPVFNVLPLFFAHVSGSLVCKL